MKTLPISVSLGNGPSVFFCLIKRRWNCHTSSPPALVSPGQETDREPGVNEDCLGPASVPQKRHLGVLGFRLPLLLASLLPFLPAERTVSAKSLNGMFGFVRPSAPEAFNTLVEQ